MRFLQVKPTQYIIVDYNYYAEFMDDIDTWCQQCLNYQPRVGMVLDFLNERDVGLFLLRWG
jgi:hypothetical protein